MAKAKKEQIITEITTPDTDCGCGKNHNHGYKAPEAYTHTDGKEYLFKAYAVRDSEGVELPAKQIFALAGGKTLCDECLENYPVLGTYIGDDKKDNGKSLALVTLMFSRNSPFLSVIE